MSAGDDALHPQMAAAIGRLATATGELGKPQSLEDARRFAVQARRWFNDEPPILASVVERTVPGPFRPIPVRVYTPYAAAARPAAIVYAHGGGWFSGNNDTHDRILRLLAIASGAAVVGIDYCLAPEHKFPKPVAEVAAVQSWAIERGAEWGLDTGRLAFAGCSAGANLALGAVLSLPRAMAAKFRAGALFYGAYDPDLSSASSREFGGPGAWLSAKEMNWCWNTYLADPANRADPRAAPVRAKDAALAALPPLYLCAAEIDPLRDDTLDLAQRLADARVPHKLTVREGMGHSFLGFARMVDDAVAVLQDAGGFFKAAWAQPAAAEKREERR